MSPVRLITCDVTNTIIRVAGSVGKQYACIASSMNKTVDPSAINTSFKTAYKEHVLKYPNFGASSGLTTYKWWTDVVLKTFSDAGSDIPEVEMLELSERLYQYFSTTDAWEILPGAVQTLQNLKSRGLNLAAISNFDERLETILCNLDLKNYFDFILVSAIEKVEKPDPEIFQRAIRTSGVSAMETIHIGDNVLTDYFGAKNAGMQGLLVGNKEKYLNHDIDQRYIISDISGLLKFV